MDTIKSLIEMIKIHIGSVGFSDTSTAPSRLWIFFLCRYFPYLNKSLIIMILFLGPRLWISRDVYFRWSSSQIFFRLIKGGFIWSQGTFLPTEVPFPSSFYSDFIDTMVFLHDFLTTPLQCSYVLCWTSFIEYWVIYVDLKYSRITIIVYLSIPLFSLNKEHHFKTHYLYLSYYLKL